MKFNRSGGSVLNSIVQEINYDLLDADLIAIKHGRKVRIHTDPEIKSLIGSSEPDHIDDIGDHVTDLVIHGNDIHASGFHF